jgi:hypothetical protein
MTLLLLLACSTSDLDSGEMPSCEKDCSLPGCETDPACYEDCSDGLDNDGDGNVDCLDPDCLWQPRCSEDCEDGQDNDFDGLIDCLDPDCGPECPEDCEDGQDNDFDGFVDCDDHDCAKGCPEDCTDGVDNNLNTRIDCQDSDCWGHEACDEDCSDGVDNDEDTLTDCQDPECRLYEDCIEDCSDGVDNDEDGLTDCEDWTDCRTDPNCAELCDDGVDNDYDGITDCWDSDCAGSPLCLESCSDGRDNDLDGLVDCEDADCQFECSETDCTDGLDNNANGRADCEDEECWGFGECENALGLRVLSGNAHWESTYFRRSWSGKASYRLTLNSPSGTATIGVDGSSLNCVWWAQVMSLISFKNINTTFYSSSLTLQTSSAGISLQVNGLSSTGGCSPWLSSEALSFSTFDNHSYTHAVTFQHELVAGGGMFLDGARLVGGSLTWSSSAHPAYAWAYPVDPWLTEPWIFGP